MRAHTGEALILRTYRYGEADRIVVFLTEDRGKRRGVARNASNSRRRFGAGLEPLTEGRVAYVEREGRELVRLDRIEPRRSPFAPAGGRTDAEAVQALAAAAYFAELLDEWAPDGSPNERLYRLGAAVADALGTPAPVDALSRYFEYWLLRLEGVYPSLDACARCGRAALGHGGSLGVAERGFVCEDCGRGSVRVSADAFGFLRAARTLAPGAVGTCAVAGESLAELERAHHLLMTLHLERELRSARIVKELRSTS
ncbi:MAG TPA: DNA repair protein RecO [Vicinamibacterales bacterium]|nr:DNA repair protein RecO [Vicinamibacterales bacterium]